MTFNLNKTIRNLTLLAAVSAVTLLQGCFTGVESTPKITDKDLRRQHVEETQEEKFAKSLVAPHPKEWQPGRRFLVTDAKLSMLLAGEPRMTLGDTLVYRGVRDGISITGDSVGVLLFATSRGDVVGYSLGRRIEDAGASFKIPFTTDLDQVRDVAESLTERRIHVLTPLRVDREGRPVNNGQKYIPVIVKNVLPGNDLYPLLVEISDENGVVTYVAMTASEAREATRNFNIIFSFSDPRLKYPAITDAVWQNIINGTVSTGMTTQEALLALGSPGNVNKWQNGGTYFERWTFDNGSYLIFEDGLLTNFRL